MLVSDSAKSNVLTMPHNPDIQTYLPEQTNWPADLELLRPLNIDRVTFAQKQRQDPWLGPLAHYLISGNSSQSIAACSDKVKRWVHAISKRTQLIDGLIFYSDELM